MAMAVATASATEDARVQGYALRVKSVLEMGAVMVLVMAQVPREMETVMVLVMAQVPREMEAAELLPETTRGLQIAPTANIY